MSEQTGLDQSDGDQNVVLARGRRSTLLESSRGQEASVWRVYKSTDGLAESACASVSVNRNGRVLVTHPNEEFISELDGYTVKTVPWPAARSGRVRATPGGQIWALAPEGFEEWQGNVWVSHPVPEIAAELQNGLAHPFRPIPFCPIRQGRVVFLLPQRLMEFDVKQPGPRLDHCVADRRPEPDRTVFGHDAGAGWRIVDHGRARFGPACRPGPDRAG